MSVYVIAQLKFKQREFYSRYQSRFLAVFKNFNGKLLIADEQPTVLEGEWPRDKVVMMEFPDEAAARHFLHSPEYEAIAVDRKAGADGVVLMLRGLE